MGTGHTMHVSDPWAQAVTLAAKLDFLRQPGAYAEATSRVDAVETHMSWVFSSPIPVPTS